MLSNWSRNLEKIAGHASYSVPVWRSNFSPYPVWGSHFFILASKLVRTNNPWKFVRQVQTASVGLPFETGAAFVWRLCPRMLRLEQKSCLGNQNIDSREPRWWRCSSLDSRQIENFLKDKLRPTIGKYARFWITIRGHSCRLKWCRLYRLPVRVFWKKSTLH